VRPSVTCFGGVGEIGGNKILLEDKDTKVFLDFGTGFTDGLGYFDAGISPRKVNGAGDLFEFGLLPEIPGLYSDSVLQNTSLKPSAPEIDAIVLSHYHYDHMGRIGYVHPDIPVYCGRTTALIHEASMEAGSSPLVGHEIRTFRTGDKFRVGSIEFVPIHVDHSIPGAYGFVIYTSKGAIAYTGDFRFHGPVGSMTEQFASEAGKARPSLLLTEGTRVTKEDDGRNFDEDSVLSKTVRAIGKRNTLVFSSFRGNDVDRVNTFYRASELTGRTLVVSMRTAALLEALANDMGISVPRLGKDVLVYLRRKGSGSGDDRDYYKWERPYLRYGISAREVHKRQRSVFLHLDVWNFPEIIDVKPDRGGAYIHSTSEAFNEEGEKEEDVIRNWTDHLGFTYHQIHASGHAPASGVRKLVGLVNAKMVLPLHTEHPEAFRSFNCSLTSPEKGKPVVF
jgi:ribonuclease J